MGHNYSSCVRRAQCTEREQLAEHSLSDSLHCIAALAVVFFLKISTNLPNLRENYFKEERVNMYD